MKKKILVILCIVSIVINIFQLYKMREYYAGEKFYTNDVESGFKSLIQGFNFYDGRTYHLSNESAIKNSLVTIAGIRDIAHL